MLEYIKLTKVLFKTPYYTIMSFSQTLVYKIHKITYILDESATQILTTGFGISYDEFMILNMIFNYPKINQKALAGILRIGKSAVSQKLNKLEKKDLLIRVINPDSKRDKTLKLTSKGEVLFQETSQILNQSSQDIFAKLSNSKEFEQELDRLIQCLEKK
jgi:DNA-binding MarR family transcriptional regulator